MYSWEINHYLETVNRIKWIIEIPKSELLLSNLSVLPPPSRTKPNPYPSLNSINLTLTPSWRKPQAYLLRTNWMILPHLKPSSKNRPSYNKATHNGWRKWRRESVPFLRKHNITSCSTLNNYRHRWTVMSRDSTYASWKTWPESNRLQDNFSKPSTMPLPRKEIGIQNDNSSTKMNTMAVPSTTNYKTMKRSALNKSARDTTKISRPLKQSREKRRNSSHSRRGSRAKKSRWIRGSKS